MTAEARESTRAALRRPEPRGFRGQHLKEKAQMREITTGATAALVAALLGTSPAEANDRGLKGTMVNPFSCYVPDLARIIHEGRWSSRRAGFLAVVAIAAAPGTPRARE
jgi:hypothetical protein